MDDLQKCLSYRAGSPPVAPLVGTIVSREEVERLAPDVLDYLEPDDIVVNLELVRTRLPAHPPSALRELLALAGVSHVGELGAAGPVKASRATDENRHVSHELRIFETVFARDALRVAWFLADAYPRLARATVLALAAAQGVEEDQRREEEPGRIPHELRSPDDPVARRISGVLGWGWPYYGSVDATPLFLQVAAAAVREDPGLPAVPVQGHDGRTRTLGQCLDEAVRWLCRRLDDSPFGLLEHRPGRPGSIENQVWRDSWDAYFHADGELVDHSRGVAALDAQALAYDALVDMAERYQADGRADRAAELSRRARTVWEAVHGHFWVDGHDGAYFALGLDYDPQGRPRPLAVRASDMGHLLSSGLLDGQDGELQSRREVVVRAIFSDELLCAAGVRSISSRAARFHPGGYHIGSSWLWDTCLVASGLDRHGYHGLGGELRQRCLAVVQQFRKFPEFTRGDGGAPRLTSRVVDIYSSADRRLNRFEQPPQEVQAWTVAAILDVKRHNGRRALGRPEAQPRQASGPERRLEAELLDRCRDRPGR